MLVMLRCDVDHGSLPSAVSEEMNWLVCAQLQKKGLEFFFFTTHVSCFSANQNVYTVNLPHITYCECVSARTHLLCTRQMLHRMIGGMAVLILLSTLCKCTSFPCGNHTTNILVKMSKYVDINLHCFFWCFYFFQLKMKTLFKRSGWVWLNMVIMSLWRAQSLLM